MVMIDTYNVSTWESESAASLILGQFELFDETLSSFYFIIIITVVESLQSEACVFFLYSAVMVIGIGGREKIKK